MLSQTLRLTGGRIWGLQVGRCWASSQADRRRWRRRGDGLWVEGANDCLQQIAADRFSTLQDVIAILLQGFVRPGWFHGRITSFVYF